MFRNRKRADTYEFGPFRLDVVVRQLYLHNKPIPLPGKTFDILKILVEHHGQIVGKEDLISQVWPNQFIEDNNLTVRVAALRKTLMESADTRFIETVFGYGYRFVARVEERSSYRQDDSAGRFLSLAVLPLMNENNQQRLNYICDGITENLINSLSELSGLKVMSRSSVFRYRGRDVDVLVAGEELGVSAILVGTLNQITNSIVINIELVDVKDGSRFWGATYRRQVSELVAIEVEIAGEVSESLRLKLTEVDKSRMAKLPTDNSQAFHLYLKGRYVGNRRTEIAVKKSIEYFRKAVSKDPQYALAYAGLCDAYLRMAGYGLAAPRKTVPKARAAVLKALELDDQLAEAHVSLGLIRAHFEWDWAGGEKAFRRAIQLNPNNGAAHHYLSMVLARRGHLEEAQREIMKAFELDPLSVHIHLAIARIYYFLKQYEAAAEQCKGMLEIDPKIGTAHGVLGLIHLARNQYEPAIKELKAMLPFSGMAPPYRKEGGTNEAVPVRRADPEAIGTLGYAYGMAGKTNEAIEMLKILKAQAKKRYVEPHAFALVYIGLKDYDQAFEWLERGLADRNNVLTYIKVWLLFDPIRDDPRYLPLVSRMGL